MSTKERVLAAQYGQLTLKRPTEQRFGQHDKNKLRRTRHQQQSAGPYRLLRDIAAEPAERSREKWSLPGSRQLSGTDNIARLDFAQVRKLTITALFSDDQLMEKLVLKGGNALSLVYQFSPRSSLDLDFSIAGDLTDVPNAEDRIFRALRDRFDSAGFVVFDESLRPKPEMLGPDQPASWGGYEVSFKLIERSRYERLRGKLDNLRREALVIGPSQRRVFTVDLSKHEYCESKKEMELDHYTIYVYTPAMIAIEKLRAICQQMPEYPHRRHPGTARARDFYDIHLLITTADINLNSDVELMRHIFAAKEVPLHLLSLIASAREFHRPDWPAVVNSVGQPLEDFDFYFEFVLGQVDRLKALWVE